MVFYLYDYEVTLHTISLHWFLKAKCEYFIQGLTGSLAYVIFTCVIGTSFQFGYSTGVVNAPEGVGLQCLDVISINKLIC